MRPIEAILLKMGISGGKLLVIVAILAVYAGSCSGSGGSYGGRTTPIEGPTTLRPDPTNTCDISDLECLDYRHARRPSFWKNRKTLLSLPNFHGHNASEPIEVLPDSSVVIQNEAITSWGNWLKWRECPKGMYAMGTQYYMDIRFKNSTGILYLNFLCRTPGGSETDKLIEAFADGQTRPATALKDSNVCTGAIVGFKLLVPRANDNLATDTISTDCSTDLKKRAIKLVGRTSNRTKQYRWTKNVYCRRHQAMCGFQVEMQKYSVVNNLRIKCCEVPDPYRNCIPTEERIQIRICDNFDGKKEGLRCEFETKIGLSLDYQDPKDEKVLIFYSSIGYDFLSIKDGMKNKIISKLRNESDLEYPWNYVHCHVEKFETSTLRTICLKPLESVEVYQVVGRCGYFLMRTNRFVKVITNRSGKSEEYWDV